MKIYSLLFVIITLVFILAPAAAVRRSPEAKTTAPNVETESSSAVSADEDDVIKVFRSADSKVEVVSELEYVVGALAAEMPPTYHEEALKAQAVACYTYALYNKMQQLQSPTKALSGAYLTDTTNHQGYLSKDERFEKWGDKAEAYEEKTETAVREVLGKALTYDGELIVAAFHAICSGKTESAKVVWGEDVPYLQSVISDGDRLSPDYSDTLVLTKEQFEQLLSIDSDKDAAEWVGDIETADSGVVISIEICGKKFSGSDVRTALGLRSCAFTIKYDDGSFSVKTVGYGHFVGMSQYGADYMARQGAKWEEIAMHYYSGITITDV